MFRKIYTNISITLIKQLREASGSPINECKKALESTDGNFEKAIQYLKERGLAQAEKKLGNQTKQGVIVAYTNNKVAALAEINCETDFVARTSEFLEFSTNFIKTVINQEKDFNSSNIDSVLKQSQNQAYFETSIDDKRKQLVGKLQENIVIGNLNTFVATKNSVFGIYQHNCLKNTICGLGGSIVELITEQELNDVKSQILREGANNLAVTYLGLKPKFLYEQEVSSDVIDQIRKEVQKDFGSKTPQQQNFIVQGKLQNYYSDNVFEHQEYILNEDEPQTIKQYIKKELEDPIKDKVKIGRCLYLTI
ncbi:unnamed protein product [Paramecium pentaurelia]|uniref:Elongation factor Ts, mitochondrial n=1 Tax=Paramecium pentaurelia TaxID=43138 RepID=A0A8S1UU22_9CILI|nr:unnamed protein product [Paramecium pentaurelia]